MPRSEKTPDLTFLTESDIAKKFRHCSAVSLWGDKIRRPICKARDALETVVLAAELFRKRDLDPEANQKAETALNATTGFLEATAGMVPEDWQPEETEELGDIPDILRTTSEAERFGLLTPEAQLNRTQSEVNYCWFAYQQKKEQLRKLITKYDQLPTNAPEDGQSTD